MLALKELSHGFDVRLRESAKNALGFVEFQRDERTIRRNRETILTQSIHHATEHRAQIASALEAKGFTPVNLDDLDLWAFEKDSE